MVVLTGSLEDLCKEWGIDPATVGEFKPHVSYNEPLDWLEVRLEDATVTMPLIGGVVDLFLNMEQNKIVGVRIWSVSQLPRGQDILRKHGFIK